MLPLEGLIPAYCLKYCEDEVIQASEKYEQFLESSSLLMKGELKLWKKKWVDESKRPETATEALKDCNKQFFPNVYVLLQIFGTIPVTTSTPERSFSTLRRIKTYLRNTMGQVRLNGLALANIHKEREMDIENIIDIFSKEKQRRMSMTNWAEVENVQ
ncbi:52 kDa repressor of the inhibitor of the protein kinase-like [Schistocerca americana]|uniref:52 kDa repressor of the inhibitor of the protein kinase-like n=1 Tax=Schistocerca americana TaxID=7009 RepID=UPI001F5011A6|nr:52 kDa repressor of the inhibitor of the protein kinase-like [Schistocerca americana]